MSLFKSVSSAIGRLITIGVLLAAFLVGMGTVVYMSLSGNEIRVPEITGKDFVESEKELAALGLRIKKRADRPSTEKINTVLEQLPRAGETVKSGQMILVVVAKAGEAGEVAPKSVIKEIEADDTQKIEEMISDKPRRPRTPANANANVERKTAETTRDVIANTGSSPSNTAAGGEIPTRTDDPARRETQGQPAERPGRETAPPPTPRPQPTAAKPPSDGEIRPRTTPKP